MAFGCDGDPQPRSNAIFLTLPYPVGSVSVSEERDGRVSTFAPTGPRLMMLAQVGPDPPPLCPPLHYRSNTIPRGAALVLPALDSGLFSPEGAGRHVVIVLTLASVAVVALLVAAIAYLNDHRRGTRRRRDDDDLFTTTPLPVSHDAAARGGRGPEHPPFTGLRIPRWVQAGSLLVALGITWSVAQRLRPNDPYAQAITNGARATGLGRARSDPEESPEDLGGTPESDPAFAFRVREWVARDGGGCAGRLEVTKGQPGAWSLTARVHDSRGQLIDSAQTRVADLRDGEVVHFSFPRADCDRIGAWDVRGGRPTP